MMKNLHIIIIVLVQNMFYGCTHDSSDKTNVGNAASHVSATEPTFAKTENLRFSYSTEKVCKFLDGNVFDLKCKLHNGNSDTLYFLTYTCYGWEQNFLFDTSKIQIHSMIDCFVSKPVIKKIEPRGDFDFNGHFFVEDQKLKTIQVDYYILQVDQKFDTRNSDSIKKLKKTIIRNTYNPK